MTTQLLLLSTCGTSGLTYEAAPEIRRWLTEIANKAILGTADAKRLDEHVAERKDRR